MNEWNKLIKDENINSSDVLNSRINNISILNKYKIFYSISLNKQKRHNDEKIIIKKLIKEPKLNLTLEFQKYIYKIFLLISFLIFLKFGIKYILNKIHKDTLIPILDPPISHRNKLNYFNYKYEVPKDEYEFCNSFEPFESFNKRFKMQPIDVCRGLKSSHVCYQNNQLHYGAKSGIICKMENLVIDPSKWKEDGYTYFGPVDAKTRGCPILEHGFFNMKCEYRNKLNNINEIYDVYYNSWNYDYDSWKTEEELAPGKIVFFISRNQDSPNVYFGGIGIINALAMIYYFKLDPEKIQVVFLESMKIENDPYYDFYRLMISRGGNPIHIRDLKKKYHISTAIHVPINWDSPCFILFNKIPVCKYQTKSFYLLNQFIDKYMNIPKFTEPLSYDKETFYYPKSVKNPNSSKYKKYVTFQWRKAWPRGRKGQGRLIGNGPKLVEKIAKILPKNILVRLVDTASLTMIEQISLMRKTDYYIGVHGAGLFLSVFLPTTSILHEISLKRKTNNLLLMSFLSGHRTFCDIWDAPVVTKDESEYVYFDPDSVAKSVLKHMNEENFFNKKKK